MPELPEVETVARGLQREVAGLRIESIFLGKADFIDDPAALERELPGKVIARVERFGKFLLLRLAGGAGSANAEEALLVHLGMTGILLPRPVTEPRVKHTHVVFTLEDNRELRFIDPRRFGRIAFLAGATLKRELERFGADPLEISSEEFSALIRGRRARIKAMLLDQSVLRGVGNIYADESLWTARVHPAQTGERLSLATAGVLHASLQKILRNAIELRGSSISDFVDADGAPGEYQLHHQVYGGAGKPCPRCSTRIRRIVVAGRSSFFCPACQRAPRGRKEFKVRAQRRAKATHRAKRKSRRSAKRNRRRKNSR